MSTGSRTENLRYILRILLAEREEYAEWQIPDTLEKRQTLMRALLNVRPPQPVNPKFLQAQDTELKQQLADKGIVTLSDIPSCRFPFERLAAQKRNITLVRINRDHPNAQSRMNNLLSFDENIGSILSDIGT